MNPAELRFAAYADQHGYEAEFEPGWAAKFDRDFGTDPDFLVARDGFEAIIEVRDFETRPLSNHFGARRGGAVAPAIMRRPLYYGMGEKAKQLEPFADVGLPLVIALTNTTGAEVDLGDHEMTSAMFGEVSVAMPLDASVGEADVGAAHHVSEPGFGVFCGTDSMDQPVNRWPHVSGVAVFARFDRYTEFQERDRREYVEARNPSSWQERGVLAAEWAATPIGRREAPGPTGFDFSVTYYDLAGYALGAGRPVSAGWFDGPRDRRFGFDSTGGFGPVPQHTAAR
jgi:hypothetical protein